MQWSWMVPVLIVATIGICTAFTTWIKAKHGYPLEDDNGNAVHRTGPDAERKIALLSNENERLTGQVSRLEERIAVLERIATDPAERLGRDIDALR